MSETKHGTLQTETLKLERMDFAALRNECGDCEDENGVSLWTILESLRGYGVKEVNLF